MSAPGFQVVFEELAAEHGFTAVRRPPELFFPSDADVHQYISEMSEVSVRIPSK